jgi:hypothetical protein
MKDRIEAKTMICPSFERLIDYVDSRLPEEEAAGLASHLANGCRDCEESRQWYERLQSIVASDDLLTPPQWAFNRAIRIFDRPLHRPALAERIAQGIAQLVFDSFARPSLAGVRSTETSNRQLLYSAGDYSIDLSIAPSERTGVDLEGQILNESDPTFVSVSRLKLEIARGEEVLFTVLTDNMGEFKVSRVPQGVYDLRVDLSDGSLTIPAVPVRDF